MIDNKGELAPVHGQSTRTVLSDEQRCWVRDAAASMPPGRPSSGKDGQATTGGKVSRPSVELPSAPRAFLPDPRLFFQSVTSAFFSDPENIDSAAVVIGIVCIVLFCGALIVGTG